MSPHRPTGLTTGGTNKHTLHLRQLFLRYDQDATVEDDLCEEEMKAPDKHVTRSLLSAPPPLPPSPVRFEDLVRGGFQPRLPTSLPPPGQQQQPSPLPRRQPVPMMPPAQLHPGAPQVVAPAPAVPLQSPPPSELMDVDPSAGPPSQAVAVQPVLQPLSLGTPKESDTAAPCPAPTQQPSTQRQETLPLFVGPDAPSRPVPEAAPVVTGRDEGSNQILN
ncbi:vegetative cell wall protein gp1-like [Schistocerca americana]|uniref:vegetative cell wall protein gp1-like n=1 Tax=Schistocerca americana TaxID=7009 RepID=UPI001F4FDE7B|nr:vegetative cell wall protein gp1-like [Schistocerca americana]